MDGFYRKELWLGTHETPLALSFSSYLHAELMLTPKSQGTPLRVGTKPRKGVHPRERPRFYLPVQAPWMRGCSVRILMPPGKGCLKPWRGSLLCRASASRVSNPLFHLKQRLVRKECWINVSERLVIQTLFPTVQIVFDASRIAMTPHRDAFYPIAL